MWSALLEFNTPPRTWAQNRIRGRCAIGLLLLLLRWSLSFFFCSSYRTHIIIEYSRPAVCVYIYKVDDDEDGAAEMRGKNMFWYRDYYKTEEKKVDDMYMALKMGSIVFRSSTIRSRYSMNNACIQFSSLYKFFFLVLSFLFAFNFFEHIFGSFIHLTMRCTSSRLSLFFLFIFPHSMFAGVMHCN